MPTLSLKIFVHYRLYYFLCRRNYFSRKRMFLNCFYIRIINEKQQEYTGNSCFDFRAGLGHGWCIYTAFCASISVTHYCLKICDHLYCATFGITGPKKHKTYLEIIVFGPHYLAFEFNIIPDLSFGNNSIYAFQHC